MTNLNSKIKSGIKLGPYTIFTGILLVLLGTVGIVLPGLMSLGTVVFVSWLLIIGGIFWAIHTIKYNPEKTMEWIKPALLLASGGLMLFYPVSGVAAIGMLLAFYLLLDAFGSFALAQSLHPEHGWVWMVFNGLFSLILALLFLVGWPETSLWLVGLYVSISLLFDGGALVAIGIAIRRAGKE